MRIFTAIIIAATLTINAQERLAEGRARQALASPIVNADGSITFNVAAPSANDVKVWGNWMGQGDKPLSLAKDSDGVWSVRTSALPSDMYSYSVIVDGVTGLDPLNVYTLRDIASVTSIVIVPNGKGDDYAVKDVPHGTVSARWYRTDSLDMTRRINVYTPAGYEESDEKYPVLYLLHGMGGDEEAWLTSGRAAQILDNMIARGEVKPMVVVMPNGHTSIEAAPGYGSEGMKRPYTPLPDFYNGDMERSFGDVMRWVESNYRVRTDAAGTGVAGLSMGGFNASNISANYPGEFDYVGLFSPGMRRTPSKSWVFDNLASKRKTQSEKGYKLFWIGIGSDDFLYDDVKRYRETLDSEGFVYEYHESAGGHTWSNWRDYLRIFLPKLF